MPNYTSPSKAKEAADAQLRREQITAAVAEAGTLTSREIVSLVPGASLGAIGYMVRIGMLEGHDTGRRDGNSNHVYAYSLAGNDKPVIEQAEKGITLADIWVRELPQGVSRHIKETHSHSVTGWRGVGIQSSVPVMMLFCG